MPLKAAEWIMVEVRDLLWVRWVQCVWLISRIIFLDALASLDFTLVSKLVSEWVVVSNLRHLSLYILDKRHRVMIKDQGS